MQTCWRRVFLLHVNLALILVPLALHLGVLSNGRNPKGRLPRIKLPGLETGDLIAHCRKCLEHAWLYCNVLGAAVSPRGMPYCGAYCKNLSQERLSMADGMAE